MTVLVPKSYAKPVADRQHERAVRSAQVLESYAVGLTLRSVKVKLVSGSGAPAFSSSDHIWIDEAQLADLTTVAGVASLKGLTLHEIAHILLTPREGNQLRQWVTDNKVFQAFNALEDQRIETLLSAQYPPIKDWLTYTIGQYLLKDPSTLDRAFPLIRGRKYLSADIRRMVKDAYINQHDVAELSDLIDTYRLLNLTRFADQEKAKDIIERYNALVNNLPPVQQGEGEGEGGTSTEGGCGKGGWSSMPDPNGHTERGDGGQETNSSSQPLKPKEQDKAIEKAKAEEPEDLSDQPEPTEDEGSDGGAGTAGDSGDKTDQPAEPTPPANGAGNGESLRNNIEDLLKDVVNEVLERLEDQIATDIGLYSGDVLLEGEKMPEPDRFDASRVEERSPRSDIVVASDEFASELLKLRASQDPAWVRRTPFGKVNPLRWERGCEIDEAFDRMKSGQADATDIECVILLDVSDSMHSEVDNAYQSMWAIKNALDSVSASTTVVAYGYRSNLLYGADEVAGVTYRLTDTQGGTNPFKSVQYAHSVLANSKRAIRILINITDGQWSDSEKCDEAILDIRDGGVLTALAYIGWSGKEIDNHNCEIGVHLANASDLFVLGQHLVEVGIERNLVH